MARIEELLEKDVRWVQRFSNYCKALEKLSEAIPLLLTTNNKDSVIYDVLKEGLIQRFEYTHELAWNVMKDYAEYQGNNMVGGSRDATREALRLKIIENGHVWMDMINSRNNTTHTYNEETAEKVFVKIINEYYDVFMHFKSVMEGKVCECDTD